MSQRNTFASNIKTCYKCGKKWNSITSFGDSMCSQCRTLKAEQEAKIHKAMQESYCPFCKMLLAEHKPNEAQLCLFNLRGYLTKEADG